MFESEARRNHQSADGEAASQFLSLIETHVDTEDGCERLYDRARVHIGSLIRSHGNADSIRRWKLVLNRAAGFVEGRIERQPVPSETTLALRLKALRDLMADAEVFQDHYAVEKLKGQPHYADFLRLLAIKGQLGRDEIIRKLKLTQPNATRVLKIMEQARLIVRKKLANKIQVLITDEGKTTLDDWSQTRAKSEDNNMADQKPAACTLRMESRVPGMRREAFAAVSNVLGPRDKQAA